MYRCVDPSYNSPEFRKLILMTVPVGTFKLVRRRSLGQISGGSALLDAVSNGKVHLAKFILAAIDQKDIVDTKDFQGKTPLIRANYISDEKIRRRAVELLLWHGAHVNIQDRTGRTALSYACQMQRNDVIKLLVKCNVDPDLADYLGNTPLINAVKANNDVGVGILLRCFKRLGLGVNRKNLEGKSALDIAESMGYKDCAKLLIQVGKAGTFSSDDMGVSSAQTALQASEKSSKKYGQGIAKGMALRGLSISIDNYGLSKKQVNKFKYDPMLYKYRDQRDDPNRLAPLTSSTKAVSQGSFEDSASSGDGDSSDASSFAMDDIPISADELAREKELVDLLLLGRNAHMTDASADICGANSSIASSCSLLRRSLSLPASNLAMASGPAIFLTELSIGAKSKREDVKIHTIKQNHLLRERKKSHDSSLNHRTATKIQAKTSINAPTISKPPPNGAASNATTPNGNKKKISITRGQSTEANKGAAPVTVQKTVVISPSKPREIPDNTALIGAKVIDVGPEHPIGHDLHHKRVKKISAFNNVKLLTSKITSSSSNKMAAIGMKLCDTRLDDELIDVNAYKNSGHYTKPAGKQGGADKESQASKEDANKISSKLKGSLLSLKPTSMFDKYFKK